MKATSRRRFELKAEAPIICEGCQKTIRTGQQFVAIVRWSEKLINTITQEEWNNDHIPCYKVEVDVILNPIPQTVTRIIDETEEGWTLKDSPEIKVYHREGCGVGGPRMKTVSGSYGMGKRR